MIQFQSNPDKNAVNRGKLHHVYKGLLCRKFPPGTQKDRNGVGKHVLHHAEHNRDRHPFGPKGMHDDRDAEDTAVGHTGSHRDAGEPFITVFQNMAAYHICNQNIDSDQEQTQQDDTEKN
ncbi:hypothetical protein SDC9_122870 [bioreactor metagenome]|uniref:Uncharacterized protein n=1 Tax=bioreactor metagenome TaxID=1076179 RepID=A0A645CFU2_9ZZZZ